MSSYYMDQKRRTYGIDDKSPFETIETQRAEIDRLKKQLEQRPQLEFKTGLQREFEESPEFENCLSFFLLRFLKEKHFDDFQDSQHFQSFQGAAGDLFIEYENNYKKENIKNGQNNKKGDKPGKADVTEITQ